MTAYYNEFDSHAADWLENLIREGVIAHGIVDRRDIRDIEPRDLDGFTQCHFFAGIGVWPYALRLAGWPDDRPVWTGSCPCPPFSAAGKKKSCPECGSRNLLPHVGRTGVFVCCACGCEWLADDRHLWPELWRLLRDRRPPAFYGEQVASADGVSWLALVRASMEILGYAVRGGDVPAAGAGSPNCRQRLFFVADAQGVRLLGRSDDRDGGRRECASGQGREAGELGDANGAGLALGSVSDDGRGALWREGEASRAPGDQRRTGPTDGLGDAERPGRESRNFAIDEPTSSLEPPNATLRTGPTNGFWQDADWLGCTDGKWRPVEPSTFPLVDGSAFRLGSGSPFEGKSRAKMLRGYGNAINAEVARLFIEASMEAVEDCGASDGGMDVFA